MIVVQGNNFFKLVKSALFNLYEKKGIENKAWNIWKEDSAVIIKNFDEENNNFPIVRVKGKKFVPQLNYLDYFPFIKKEVVGLELDYWSNELLISSRLEKICNHLAKYPESKRAIITLWKEKYMSPSIPSSCAVYLFFRKKGKLLEMHTHMRSNNAYFLLFIDMSILLEFQKMISRELELEAGNYIHFVDIFLFFEKEREAVEKQYNFMKSSAVWYV
jgi:thymidylate synthase